MTNQERTEQGKFLSKSDVNRHVRSLRLTDSVWNKFGEMASEQSLTRADFLEKLVKQNMLNVCDDKLKSIHQGNSVTLSNETISKLD